jgi:hypothetical protein
MQDEAVIRELMRALWYPDPQGPVVEVFALLDGARDPRIYPFAQRPGIFSRCLFRGALDPQFARSAPYILSLSRFAAWSRELLNLAWGESWGVFFQSAAGLPELQEHFRRFLQVEDAAGKSYFFRFYDPRVLRLYLPSCTRPELETLFGPVRRFILEAEDARQMDEFTLEKGRLRRWTTPVVKGSNPGDAAG